MVEESTVTDDDWRSGPDWVAHLAEEVGRALVASDDGEMLELLDEVDALLQGLAGADAAADREDSFLECE